MLTKDLAIAHYDFRQNQIIPDRLTTRQHGHYLTYAEQMLETYRHGTGLRRRDLHRRVHGIFDEEPDCPQRRIDAFCKLLDDESDYADTARRKAPALRQRVFRIAAAGHPLVTVSDRLFDTSCAEMRNRIAKELGRSWAEIEDDLFADVIEYHRLKQFHGYSSARALLSRYNVAQIQAALFSALSMDLWVTGDFKRILRSIRLARLMHSITRVSEGSYHIRLDGPASVLRETRRYGIGMARFLPALISCQGWRIQASIQTRTQWRLNLLLSDQDGLRSHLPDDEVFDSTVEADFAEKWGTEPREGWTMHHEAEFLHSGQKTFVPDFVFRHPNKQPVFLEIVGFWTPEYIESRKQTHSLFADRRILMAIHESTKQHFQESVPDSRTIVYRNDLAVRPVLDALAAIE